MQNFGTLQRLYRLTILCNLDMTGHALPLPPPTPLEVKSINQQKSLIFISPKAPHPAKAIATACRKLQRLSATQKLTSSLNFLRDITLQCPPPRRMGEIKFFNLGKIIFKISDGGRSNMMYKVGAYYLEFLKNGYK